MLMWSTLHPLFQAENVLWQRGPAAELRQFPHQDIDTEAVAAQPDAAHAGSQRARCSAAG